MTQPAVVIPAHSGYESHAAGAAMPIDTAAAPLNPHPAIAPYSATRGRPTRRVSCWSRSIVNAGQTSTTTLLARAGMTPPVNPRRVRNQTAAAANTGIVAHRRKTHAAPRDHAARKPVGRQ